MTLTEARRTLERYQKWSRYEGPVGKGPEMPDPKEVGEAIDKAIAVLPGEVERPTARQRLAQIREAISESEGFDPFANKSRDRDMVGWRQCVYLIMGREGYTLNEIGRAAGFDHATILWGARRQEGYIESGDKLSVGIWERINEILKDESADN